MQRRFHAVGCLVVILLVALALIFGKRDRGDDTVNTIIKAHRACEAQTGQHCD